MELDVNRLLLENGDHVVEVNERVIDGNYIYFAIVEQLKEALVTHVPNRAKSVYSNLHHCMSGMRLILFQEDVVVSGTKDQKVA